MIRDLFHESAALIALALFGGTLLLLGAILDSMVH